MPLARPLGLALLALFMAAPAQALPEDRNQPVQGTYDNSLLLLDEGKQVFYGSPGAPAEITQGSLLIRGQEITIERRDGEIRRITVSGAPAHFQQQPAVDQALVSAEGESIVLDNDAQQVSADGSVRFTQGNDLWTGCHIDYYIESRRMMSASCPDGVQSKLVLTPRKDP